MDMHLRAKNAWIAVLFLVAFHLYSAPAHADLAFCNSTSTEVWVSYAVAIGPGVWQSQGWGDLQPHTCAVAFFGPIGTAAASYFYAAGNGIEWTGDGQNNSGAFCTVAAPFSFVMRDQVPDGCPQQALYRQMAIGPNQTNFLQNLTEDGPSVYDAAKNCWPSTSGGVASFTECWVRQQLNSRERRILDCVQNMPSKASIALCAAQDNLTPDAYAIATCTRDFSESTKGDQFIECVSKYAMRNLSEDQKAIFQCSIGASDVESVASCYGADRIPRQYRDIAQCTIRARTYQAAAGCVADQYLSPEQGRVVNCFMNNTSDYIAMGLCAVGPQLTPEQQVIASCAVSTGGNPVGFAGCVGTQLTNNEIQKCFAVGIGGPGGCFGPNNTAVKTISNAWHDATRGPGPNNTVSIFLSDAQNDLRYGPGHNNDLVGRDGFVCKKLLFGLCK